MRYGFAFASSVLGICLGATLVRGAEPDGTAWRAGVASQAITPTQSMCAYSVQLSTYALMLMKKTQKRP